MNINTPDLEKTIIAELIYCANKERQLEILSEIGNDDFIDPKWRTYLTIINEIILSGKTADSITVFEYSKDRIDPKELALMSIESVTDALLLQRVLYLKEKKYKRDVIQGIEKDFESLKKATGYDECDELKNRIISNLSAINLGDVSKFINFGELRTKLFENIEKNHKIEGISWGINDLDKFTSGIIVPRLYILGGLKKGGKSRFVINLIKNISLQKTKTVFLSLEMPAYEIVKLIHSAFSGIDDLKLRSKSWLSKEERLILETTIIPKEYFEVECSVGLKIEAVLGRIKRYAKQGFKVIFIDFLQRIAHDRKNEASALEDIATKIADSTRADNVSIVLLSQLSNLAEREIPTVGHLKGSGGIGESGDCILLFDNIYRRTKREDDKNKIDIYIEQRYGDSGVIHLQSNLGTCSIKDLVYDNKENQQFPQKNYKDSDDWMP
jgi:replicative DNA helicase